MISVAALIAFFAPNSLAITNAIRGALQRPDQGSQQLAFGWVAAYGLLLGVAILFLGRVSPFLYFQF